MCITSYRSVIWFLYFANFGFSRDGLVFLTHSKGSESDENAFNTSTSHFLLFNQTL